MTCKMNRMIDTLMNFIIHLSRDLTTVCSSVKSLETTCDSEVAIFSHYEMFSLSC